MYLSKKTHSIYLQRIIFVKSSRKKEDINPLRMGAAFIIVNVGTCKMIELNFYKMNSMLNVYPGGKAIPMIQLVARIREMLNITRIFLTCDLS